MHAIYFLRTQDQYWLSYQQLKINKIKKRAFMIFSIFFWSMNLSLSSTTSLTHTVNQHKKRHDVVIAPDCVAGSPPQCGSSHQSHHNTVRFGIVLRTQRWAAEYEGNDHRSLRAVYKSEKSNMAFEGVFIPRSTQGVGCLGNTAIRTDASPKAYFLLGVQKSLILARSIHRLFLHVLRDFSTGSPQGDAH